MEIAKLKDAGLDNTIELQIQEFMENMRLILNGAPHAQERTHRKVKDTLHFEEGGLVLKPELICPDEVDHYMTDLWDTGEKRSSTAHHSTRQHTTQHATAHHTAHHPPGGPIADGGTVRSCGPLVLHRFCALRSM